MRGNAWLIEPSKFAERQLLIAWKCAELWLPIAWKCAELGPANAWKSADPRLAWVCELRGRLRTAARVRGTRVGSAREVRLKCGSSAWNRGSTHWWVPYLYGTGTLRVNKRKRNTGYRQLLNEHIHRVTQGLKCFQMLGNRRGRKNSTVCSESSVMTKH